MLLLLSGAFLLRNEVKCHFFQLRQELRLHIAEVDSARGDLGGRGDTGQMFFHFDVGLDLAERREAIIIVKNVVRPVRVDDDLLGSNRAVDREFMGGRGRPDADVAARVNTDTFEAVRVQSCLPVSPSGRIL